MSLDEHVEPIVDTVNQHGLFKRILNQPEWMRYWGIKAGSMCLSYAVGVAATVYLGASDYPNAEIAEYAAIAKALAFVVTDIPLQMYLLPERYVGRQPKSTFLSNIAISDGVGAVFNGVLGGFWHFKALEGIADKYINSVGTIIEGLKLAKHPVLSLFVSHGSATVVGTGFMWLVEKCELPMRITQYAKNAYLRLTDGR